jgi:Reverse transcriptase (RNA-dependent DNA polymerase)
MTQTLQSKFPIKYLGALHYFLGIEVFSSTVGLHLSQNRYVTSLLHRVQMHDSKPKSSPMIANQSLSKFDGDPFDNPTLYHIIVGAL